MSLAKLSRPRALEQMSSVGISFAYAYSSSAAYTIAQKHGRKALLRLHDGLQQREEPRAPGASSPTASCGAR